MIKKITFSIIVAFITIQNNYAQIGVPDLDLKSITERVGSSSPGGIQRIITEKGIHYAEFMESTTKAQKWYKYKYNEALVPVAESSLPFNVSIKKRKWFKYGTLYNGKYYYPHNNKIHVFDEVAETDTEISASYPEAIRQYGSFIVFNNKLYFSANTKKYGDELFSYSPSTGLNLIEEVASEVITLSSGRKIPHSSSPRSLFIWKDKLLYTAKDKFNMNTSTVGIELYQMDTAENVSLFKDFNPGNGGSQFYKVKMFDFENILYNYTTRKYYQLTDAGEIIPFEHNQIQNNLYEVKNEKFTDNYIVLNARTQFPSDHSSIVHLVIFEKNGTVHKFEDIQPSFSMGVFIDHYYVFGGTKNSEIGEELYAVDINTWELKLLKDIRTSFYTNEFGSVDKSSEPRHFINTGDEILFCVDKDNALWHFYTYSLRKKDAALSTEEVSIENDVRIYPNPIQSSENLQIQSKSPIKKVQLFDMNGRLVKQLQLNSLQKVSFPLNTLNVNGVYLIRLITENGVITKKIIRH